MMARCVAVAAVLLLCLGVAQGTAPTRDCKQLHEVVVNEGGKETICEETIEEGRIKVPTTVYVQPGGDFEGVSLGVEVTQGIFFSSSRQTAWFGLDKCYNEDNKWIKLEVHVEAMNPFNYTLHFNLNNGGYKGICKRSSATLNIRSLSIVAHGSSRWTSRAEEAGGGCLGPRQFTNLQNPTTCTDPPSPATTPPTTTNTTTTATPPGTTTTPSTVSLPIVLMIVVMIAMAVTVVLIIVEL